MSKRRRQGRGSVYQRQDGRWCAAVFLTTPDQKRKRVTMYGRTRPEVEQKLAKVIQQIDEGIDPRKMTVKDLLTEWLEEVVKYQNRVRTYDRYAADVRRYLIPALGHMLITELTRRHVQTMLNRLADRKLSYRSIRNVRAVLRSALYYAVRDNYLTRNVATLVQIPGEVTFTATPLTEEQAQRFLRTISGHRWELVYRIGLGLGLRKGEVLGIRWKDIDFDAATVHITGSVQRQNGRLERAPTKTDASDRVIGLPASLLTRLRLHREQQQALRSSATRWTDSGLVFTSYVGTPIEPSDLSREFKRLLMQAGLPEHIRFHDLRHSCATLLMAMDTHPRVVMELLGHSQISTTLEIYSHVVSRVQREAVAALDTLFAEVTPVIPD